MKFSTEQNLNCLVTSAFNVDLLDLEFEDQMKLYKVRQLLSEIESDNKTDKYIDNLFDLSDLMSK